MATTPPLIFQATNVHLPELAPLAQARSRRAVQTWLPGFQRAGPSTPLDKSAHASNVRLIEILAQNT